MHLHMRTRLGYASFQVELGKADLRVLLLVSVKDISAVRQQLHLEKKVTE
jgi:hypothetical protein